MWCGKQNSIGRKGRKRVWGICAVATLAAIAMLSAGSPVWAEVIIAVDDLVVDPGASITSPIMVNGVTDLAGGLISVDFDSTVVDVTNVTAGDFSFFLWSDNTHVSGDIYQLRVSTMELGGYTGDVVWANVTWTAVGSPGDSCVLTVFSDDLSDTNILPIPHSHDSGSFTITPEPSSLALLASLAVMGGLMFLWRRRRG